MTYPYYIFGYNTNAYEYVIQSFDIYDPRIPLDWSRIDNNLFSIENCRCWFKWEIYVFYAYILF